MTNIEIDEATALAIAAHLPRRSGFCSYEESLKLGIEHTERRRTVIGEHGHRRTLTVSLARLRWMEGPEP